MAVIMAKELQEKLERVKKREWWPAASLAEVLKRPKCYIYRRIRNKNFTVIEDGTFKKILSKSIIEFYENRFLSIPKVYPESDEFIRGFNAGLKVYNTARELGIDIDNLQLMIANYCEGEYDGRGNKRDTSEKT